MIDVYPDFCRGTLSILSTIWHFSFNSSRRKIFFYKLNRLAIIFKESYQRCRSASELLAEGLCPAYAESLLTAEWGCSRLTSPRDIDLSHDALLESTDQLNL